MDKFLLFAVISSVVVILYGLVLAKIILKKNAGNEKMQSIAEAIAEGAKAYLNRQYKTISIIAVILFVIIWIGIGLTSAFGFILGAILSALAGYIGMNVSVRANSRTAEAAKTGLKEALALA